MRETGEQTTSEFAAWRARLSTDAGFRRAVQEERRTFICTAAAPYTPERAKPYVVHMHPYATGDDGDEVVRYTCPICLTSWREELPQ